MSINVERLLAVKQAILDHPEQIRMEDWYSRRGVHYNPHTVPDLLGECGTAGCIAGWTEALFATGEPLAGEWNSYPKCRFTSERAARLLGLTSTLNGSANGLFMPTRMPRGICKRYYEATTGIEQAQAVADHIDAFLVEQGCVIPEPQRVTREVPV